MTIRRRLVQSTRPRKPWWRTMIWRSAGPGTRADPERHPVARGQGNARSDVSAKDRVLIAPLAGRLTERAVLPVRDASWDLLKALGFFLQGVAGAASAHPSSFMVAGAGYAE